MHYDCAFQESSKPAMELQSHYMKLLPMLEQYVRAVIGAVPDWQQVLFDDLTENGTRISYESLPLREGGPRVGISGNQFYCEAGRDTRREGDSLFVFRVEPATRRFLSRVPTHHSATFRILTTHLNAPILDPLPTGMLDSSGRVGSEILGVQNPIISSAKLSVPSQELLVILRNPSPDLRKSWLPILVEDRQPSTAFIEAFRKPWVKFQLDRFCHLTTRQESLVKQVLNTELGREERKRLLSNFNIEMLNAFATKSAPEVIAELLRSLASLPLLSTFRSAVWTSMERSLSRDEVLRDIFEGAERLRLVAETIEEAVWSRAVLAVFEDKPEDLVFKQLIDGCRGHLYPLRYVCDWITENLAFEAAPQRSKSDSSDAADHFSGSVALANSGENQLEVAIERDSDSRSTAFREWLLRLQGIDAGSIADLCQEVKGGLEEVAGLASRAWSVPSIVELRRKLEELSSKTNSWIPELPDPSRLHNDYCNAAAAYDQAVPLVGGAIDDILASAALTPNDLISVVALIQDDSHLGDLPEWVWQTTENNGIRPHESALEQFTSLIDPQLRDRVQCFVTTAKEFHGRAAWLLPLVPPVDPDADSVAIEIHVREYLGNTLELVKPLTGNVRSRLAAAQNKTDFAGKLRQCVGLCNQLRERVSDSVLSDAVDRVLAAETESAASLVCESIERTVEVLETTLGSATDISFVQLERAMGRSLRSVAPKASNSEHVELRIEHNFVDYPAKRVSLIVVQNGDTPYGHVSAPLVLYTRHRISCALSLEYEVTSGHRDGWPSEWPNPTPTELSIRADQWREDTEQPGRYQFTFGIEIPCREKGKRTDLQISLRGRDLDPAQPVTLPPSTLQWDGISRNWTPVQMRWLNTVDPKQVEQHPIGPQRHAESILQQIDASGSFCVIAPRRFGKSTLVDFLLQRAEERGFVAAPAVVCTSHRSGQVFDYEGVWSFISEELQKRLDAAISGRVGPEGLPGAAAFDSLRKQAKRQGARGILVIFDEAQLFFSERTGHELANILKDRLERHWSATSDSLVPVILGFAGLPSLTDRMGGNFAGYVRPYSQHEFGEDELNNVIRAVTENSLHTTREARRRIANTAGNMYMVRDLVSFVADSLNSQRRIWCGYDDVVRVETQLTQDLRDGRQADVAVYIRDILNDELSIWKPNPALPLAVALAIAKSRRVPDSQLFEVARQVLREWYASLATESITLEYDEQRFQEQLATLKERCVLQGKKFRSVLLENWLLGYDQTKDSEEWRSLLFSAAVKRIRIPDSLQKNSGEKGGQASVFRYVSGDRAFAYRITRLETDESRRRFAETRDLLEALREKVEDGGDGSQYMFRLEDIGLSARDDNEAVQVYRWVDGSDLSQKLNRIPPPFVADMGVKLARAVRFLHSANILHRDIRPRNVILNEESAEPVIIDFGFARRLSVDSNTRLPSDYSAPEVRCDRPLWTRSADIYALGATLRAVLDDLNLTSPVQNVLNRCLLENPEERPDAATLVSLFDKAANELHIADRKADVDQKVKSAVGEDRAKPWYNDTVGKFQGRFAAVALGLLPDQFDRCCEASNLLNQILEAYPRSKGGSKLTLGLIKNANPVTDDRLATEPIKFMHALRNFDAHGENPRPADLLNRFSFRTESQIREAPIKAAAQIAKELQVRSLPSVIELLL
jgi:Protein kinase domain/AAA domain